MVQTEIFAIFLYQNLTMQFADIKNDIAFRKIFGNEQKTTPHFIPDFANEDEGLKTAFLEADKYQWSKEELKAYDNITIKEQDERGEKEIIAQKAEKKGKMDVAKKMKDKGMTNNDIADLTGLTEDEIDSL